MAAGEWQKLDVLVDEDVVVDLTERPRGTQDAIFVAIYRFAESGRGGQVAYRAPGSVYEDELHVDGLAVRFRVIGDGKKGPTMIVSEVSPIDHDDPSVDD